MYLMKGTISKVISVSLLFSFVVLSIAPITSAVSPRLIEQCSQAPEILSSGIDNTLYIGYPYVPTGASNSWATGMSPGYPDNTLVSSSYTYGPPSYITVVYDSLLGGPGYVYYCYIYSP